MNARLRRLLEPAPTSPSDPFRWSDRRPKIKQVANGFRIAGGSIAGFVTIIAVLVGLSRLSEDPSTKTARSILVSWTVLLVAAIIMLWTANRWAPFVTGFFFGPPLLKIMAVLVFEQDSYYSSHSISRTEVAEFLVYALAVVALTLRFVDRRPPPTTFFDRVALTFFVFTSLEQVITPYHFPPWFLLSGVFALFAAWCAHRFARSKHKRGQHRDSADAPATPVGP